MAYRSYSQFVLPGNNVRQSIYESEREEAERQKALNRRNKAKQNKEYMLIFVEHLHRSFDGTEAEEPINVLISSWAKFNYNKEVFLANIMVCNAIKELESSETLFSCWKEQLNIFCTENGFQYEKFLMEE